MLISFTISNWRLFSDEVTFSMVATREEQNKESLAKIPIGINLLPIAAIYGGNASGKTSFVKALSFMQNFIVKGTLPDASINIEPFAFDIDYLVKPSNFKVQISTSDNKCYEFSFAVDKNEVIEERLIQVLKTTEKQLYYRKKQHFEFTAALAKDKRLEFIAEGTRKNQLFLTNCIGQNHEIFRPVYDWFKDSLTIITPESRFGAFHKLMRDADPLYETVNKILPFLDMGIIALGKKNVHLDSLGLPAVILQSLQSLSESESSKLRNFFDDMVIVTKKNGELVAEKITTKHRMANGEMIDFDIDKESDGSRRCIDLLPIFVDLISENSNCVYFIDEIDRSLHTELLIQLLEFYLDHCQSEKRSQLIFTTHNLLTMDQRLIRRDEMWATERNHNGKASLISFSDYKDIRYDKDIRKSYRQGRLGGLPKIMLNSVSI